MRQIITMTCAAMAGLGLTFTAAGCSSAGGKVAKHKVKSATPSLDAKGEKSIKGAKDVSVRNR